MSRGRPPAASVPTVADAVRRADKIVLTAPEVADILDITKPTAKKYLDRAVDEGELESVKVGQATAYYHPDDEEQRAGEGGIFTRLKRVFASQSDGEPASARVRGDPLRGAAWVGEQFATVGVALALVGVLALVLAGQYGTPAFVLGVLALNASVVSLVPALLILAALAAVGIQEGRVGRALAKIVPQPGEVVG